MTGILKYRHVVETRGYDEDRSPEVFINDHMNLMRKCEERDTKYFAIEMNYEEEMDQIYRFIKEALDLDKLNK